MHGQPHIRYKAFITLQHSVTQSFFCGITTNFVEDITLLTNSGFNPIQILVRTVVITNASWKMPVQQLRVGQKCTLTNPFHCMLQETLCNQSCITTCSDAFACQARTLCHSPCSDSQRGLASTVSGLPHVLPQLPMTHQNAETLQPRAAPHCTLTPAGIPFVQFKAI